MNALSVDVLFHVGVVLALVLINAFFVAAEFSIVTVRHTRVEQLVSERVSMARRLRRAVENPAPYIAATQLGVTMASLALGWIGEPYIAGLIEPLLRFLPTVAARLSAGSIAAILAFLVVTFITIILGELIPKNLALQRPEGVGLVIIEPLTLFQTIFRPFVWFLNAAGTLGLRLFGLSLATHHGSVYSVDELKLLVTASRRAGVLDESEEDMIERVFHFAELHAHDVMVPRTEMVAVSTTATIGSTIQLAAKTHHSRFPIYEETIDNVVGVVYLEDLLPRIGRGDLTRAPIRPFIREALVLPETITVDALIEEMRRHRTHLAVLVDEYGGTAGLATLIDVLERITGRIPDQFEEEPPRFERLADGSLVVDGMTRLDEVDEETGLDLQSDVYDTIGGYVLGEIGRRPAVGDQVEQEGTVFRVEAVDGLRISRVRIWLAPKPGPEEEGEKQAG